MRQYHPDKHTLQPQAEQNTAAQQATTVTHGYETLQDDHGRALHLLELGGAPMEYTILIWRKGFNWLFRAMVMVAVVRIDGLISFGGNGATSAAVSAASATALAGQ